MYLLYLAGVLFACLSCFSKLGYYFLNIPERNLSMTTIFLLHLLRSSTTDDFDLYFVLHLVMLLLTVLLCDRIVRVRLQLSSLPSSLQTNQ